MVLRPKNESFEQGDQGSHEKGQGQGHPAATGEQRAEPRSVTGCEQALGNLLARIDGQQRQAICQRATGERGGRSRAGQLAQAQGRGRGNERNREAGQARYKVNQIAVTLVVELGSRLGAVGDQIAEPMDRESAKEKESGCP